MKPEDNNLNSALQERFAQLPPVVQNAITSADVEKHLRELANTHKLHLDQWETLENEVMLALLGFQKTEDVQKNIEREVGVDAATAAALSADISKIVFEPIRQEMERQLEHPAAVAEKSTGVENMRAQILADVTQSDTGTPEIATPVPAPAGGSASAIMPATPPGPAPAGKVERAPVSPSYPPASASHERKTIEGDPYREQIA